jgi:hypothetical protein
MSSIHDILNKYYNNPVCTKLSNSGDYSMYWVRISSFLSNSKRYLIIMVDRDVFMIGDTRKLSDLKWRVFQARNVPDDKQIAFHTYQASNRPPFNTKCTLENRGDQSTDYILEGFPIRITLLHTNDTKYQYPDAGTLASALETFETVLTFI